MIPKILHLYWGKNQPLTYLRALTVLSFRKLNPDWIIKLWVPKTPSQNKPWTTGEHTVNYDGYDYLHMLKDFIFEVDFEALGIPLDTPEVHKSDLFRWYILGTEGGVWSDMDILYIQPLRDHVIGTWKGAGVCRYAAIKGSSKLFTAIGFLTSEGVGRIFFTKLFRYGLEHLPQAAYQAFGAELLDKFLQIWSCGEYVPFYHHPEKTVYPLYTSCTMLQYFTNDVQINILPETFGMHWYAGNPKCSKCEQSITFDNIEQSRYALCVKALEVLS